MNAPSEAREPSATLTPGPSDQPPVIDIVPRRGWIDLNLRELWRYRELVFVLAARDVKVRYKQTVVGALWALLQPLTTVAVFSLLFGLLMGEDGKPTPRGVPYSVSTFCALLPWQLFAYALTASSNSLIENERLITKVYFPRMLIPLASVLSGLVDFAVGAVILAALMAWFRVAPSWPVVALPLFVVLAVVTALALGLWLSALNTLYRDFRYTIPFLLQVGMFVTPVVYSAQSILDRLPTWAQVLYSLNPMAGVVEGFRWALLGDVSPHWQLVSISASATVVLLVGGMIYFRRMERTFADWI